MKLNSAPLIPLTFAMGLLCLAALSPAGAQDVGARPAAIHLAAADNEDDEEDEEEEAVDYRDRVREIQQWMNRRDSERKGDAPSLDVAPAAPPAVSPYPKYFQNNGYDANGYRRPRDEVRIRLNDAPEATYTRHYHRRHSSWHRRWHRHVHSYVRFYRHHSRHGRHHHYHGGHEGRHGYRHHSYPAGASRHYAGHASRHGGRYAFHATHPARHSSRHVKAVPTRHAAKAVTAKKGRSRR